MVVLRHAGFLCLCCLFPAGADAQTVPGGSDTSTTGGTLPSWEDESFVQVGAGTNCDSAQERSSWAHIRAGFVAGYLSDLPQLCAQHYAHMPPALFCLGTITVKSDAHCLRQGFWLAPSVCQSELLTSPPAPAPLPCCTQAAHEQDGGFIYLDAHVLCTPAIADIDGDGQEDLVLAVSYFYDK